jgi:hypothetical protein
VSRRVGLAALAALALAAAAMLALLGDSVLSAERNLEQPDPSLRAEAAEAMLGLGDDRDLRAALTSVKDARRTEGEPAERLQRNANLEAQLVRIARSSAATNVQAEAANANGVLLVEDASLDRRSTSRFLQLALESFKEAVVLDPANEDAKVNLELMVELLERNASLPSGSAGSQGSTGAGSSPEGSGY